MKILFIVYHGFSSESGISKKIHDQVNGLKQNGHDVHLCYYDFDSRGHRCRFIDSKILKNYGNGKIAAIKQRFDYDEIYKYCKSENIQIVYARSFQNASPQLVRFFKKLNTLGVKCVTEIPTYPYDSEFVGFGFMDRMKLRIDQIFRHSLSMQMKAIVTFSDANEIFGQRTINISNGVSFDAIPIHSHHNNNDIIDILYSFIIV